MRPVEFFTWLLPNEIAGGQPTESRDKLTRQQAAAYPGAVCIDNTREVRMLPDSEAIRKLTGPAAVIASLPESPQPSGGSSST